jgi:hypothetical protein
MPNYSASDNDYKDLPRGVDPDEFRSRKTMGSLRDISNGRQSVRQFMARVLIRKIDLSHKRRK